MRGREAPTGHLQLITCVEAADKMTKSTTFTGYIIARDEYEAARSKIDV